MIEPGAAELTDPNTTLYRGDNTIVDIEYVWASHQIEIRQIYDTLYNDHPYQTACWHLLYQSISKAFSSRAAALNKKDKLKAQSKGWHLSNNLAGISLYVDRFNKDIKGICSKLDYLQHLGINVLHLMPIFQSLPAESSWRFLNSSGEAGETFAS